MLRNWLKIKQHSTIISDSMTQYANISATLLLSLLSVLTAVFQQRYVHTSEQFLNLHVGLA